MSNVINKSNHPVEIKKIALSLWTLRSEIETAIAQKLSSQTTDSEPDIEVIRSYYTSHLNTQSQEDSEPTDERQDNANVDSSGNPMDDDAAAMLAALNGGDEEAESDASEEPSAEDQEESEETQDSESDSEEDAQAAELAAQMMADQNQGDSSDDDEAAALAAQMLADQGLDSSEDKNDGDSTNENFLRPEPEDKIDAFLMLSDITMEDCLIFTKAPFIQGQSIVVRFNIPNSFRLLATVSQSMDISRNSKIISAGKPSHRIYCHFAFKFPGERSNLRDFLKSIEPTIPVAPKKVKKQETDDDEDDFDDLGF